MGVSRELVIAGVTPFSSVDWPGRLAAVVFLQGCPWNCGYCQNAGIIDPRRPGSVAESELWDFLGRRRGLLDAVVFSGGEPTRQAALVEAVKQVRAWGFAVGLHTGGAFPNRLGDLLAAGLLDWVGLDIKTLPQHYPRVVGLGGACGKAGEAAWRSLDLVMGAAERGELDYEVRITAYPGRDEADTDAAQAGELARVLRARGVENLALQGARTQGTRPEFARAWDPDFPARLARVAQQVQALGFERFSFRP